jgi:hypothetical protein
VKPRDVNFTLKVTAIILKLVTSIKIKIKTYTEGDDDKVLVLLDDLNKKVNEAASKVYQEWKTVVVTHTTLQPTPFLNKAAEWDLGNKASFPLSL